MKTIIDWEKLLHCTIKKIITNLNWNHFCKIFITKKKIYRRDLISWNGLDFTTYYPIKYWYWFIVDIWCIDQDINKLTLSGFLHNDIVQYQLHATLWTFLASEHSEQLKSFILCWATYFTITIWRKHDYLFMFYYWSFPPP